MDNKEQEILKYSNPIQVVKKAKRYFGYDKEVYLSTKKDKKYMVQDDNGKWVHFGQMYMEDYTKHQDKERRKRYLARATKIKGNWKDNKYSANRLAINLLWNGGDEI